MHLKNARLSKRLPGVETASGWLKSLKLRFSMVSMVRRNIVVRSTEIIGTVPRTNRAGRRDRICWARRRALGTLLAIFPVSFAGLPACCLAAPTASSQLAVRAQEQRQAQSDPDVELRIGTELTAQGRFAEAIPHLTAAGGHVSSEFPAEFNLALCYVATNDPRTAIQILTTLRARGHETAEVNNLLAQAFIANGQSQAGFEAFLRAAAMTPFDEKLYAFVTDACMQNRDYRLGAKVADMGLEKIPNSARLLYQRGMFLAFLNRPDLADADFDRASRLAPDSDIGFLAAGQKYFLDGDIENTIRVAREGVRRGFGTPPLLTLLGVALVRTGAAPGQPEFAEAQAALERSTAEHPRDPAAQAALGELYLAAGRLDDAVGRLEIARELDPQRKNVYSLLAIAYRRQGRTQEAQKALAVLEKLNEQEAASIREAPAESKGVYGAEATGQKPQRVKQ
jgi:tetratricopeptide (TPR) repeat protein